LPLLEELSRPVIVVAPPVVEVSLDEVPSEPELLAPVEPVPEVPLVLPVP
jgi:hypothetical protein